MKFKFSGSDASFYFERNDQPHGLVVRVSDY